MDLKGDIAIDTEAMGLNFQRDKLCLVQLCDENGQICLVQFSANDYRAPILKSLLLDNERVKILHFARFDLAIMEHYLGVKPENIFCTKIASRLVRTYTESHGLKDLCKEVLNVQLSKQQQSSDWGVDTLSKEQKDYAARDVVYLHQLRDKLTFMLRREKRLDLARKLFQFLPTRVELDLLGWQETDIFAH
jgi:ribonuclease D